MKEEIDLSRYRYIPGESIVLDEDDIDLDSLGLHDFAGDPITEESCEREAVEDEKRFRAGLIPGGKSLSGDGRRSPCFQVVLGEATAAKVRAAASDAGMSVSKWIRRTLEDKVA